MTGSVIKSKDWVTKAVSEKTSKKIKGKAFLLGVKNLHS
jgi:hypothetical protein